MVIAGILHPKPVIKFINARPLIPALENVLSNTMLIRDKRPICSKIEIRKTNIINHGRKLMMVKAPPNKPSDVKPAH